VSSVSFSILYARVAIEKNIIEMTYISNFFTLWMKMWCQSHYYGRS